MINKRVSKAMFKRAVGPQTWSFEPTCDCGSSGFVDPGGSEIVCCACAAAFLVSQPDLPSYPCVVCLFPAVGLTLDDVPLCEGCGHEAKAAS